MKNPPLLLLMLLTCPFELLAQTERDSIRYHLPIVTSVGTRFAEPWLQVPLSLSYVSRNEFWRGKGYGLDEVLAGIPGVLAQSRYGNQDIRLTIRGYGARGAGERSNAGTVRGIRVLNNGFPETEPDGRTSFDLVDIAGAGGIEVIRSNASSLYGNSSGGVVNVMSNTSFRSPYATYTQSLGSFAFHKEAITAGAMLGDGRMYFSLGNTNTDGWRWHSQSTQALLTTGIVAPVGERTDLGVHVAATSNVFRIPGPLSQAQYDANPQQADSLYIKRDERRNNRLGRIGASVTHLLDESNLISASTFVQTKYLQRSERGTFRDFTRYHVGGNAIYRNTSKLGAGTSNVLLVGLDEAYQDGAILFYNLTTDGGRGTLRDNKREGANNFGLFLQDEIEFGDAWGVLAGARYDVITYHVQSFVSLNLSDSRSFSQLTPKLGVTYRLSPTHSLYANLGGGIEVPAGNETDPAPTYGQDTIYAINPLLDPIRSTTVEAGTKQMLSLGGAEPVGNLTYDVAAYWLQVTDDIIPYRNGRFYFTAGKTRRIGLELSATAEFAMGLAASVALTASRNEYEEYLVDSVHYGSGYAGKTADYAGNKVAGIPDLFGSADVKYELESLGGLYIRAHAQYVGRYYVNDANTIEVPASMVFNAGIGIERLTTAGVVLYVGGFLGVNNLANTTYIGSAWLNPDHVNGVPVYIESGLPRNVVASVWLGANF